MSNAKLSCVKCQVKLCQMSSQFVSGKTKRAKYPTNKKDWFITRVYHNGLYQENASVQQNISIIYIIYVSILIQFSNYVYSELISIIYILYVDQYIYYVIFTSYYIIYVIILYFCEEKEENFEFTNRQKITLIVKKYKSSTSIPFSLSSFIFYFWEIMITINILFQLHGFLAFWKDFCMLLNDH